MAQQGGSARLGLLFGVRIMWLFAITKPTLAAVYTVYTVGDAAGWAHNVTNWPNGKSFKAGDVLQFSYPKTEFNVVVLTNKDDYDKCIAPTGSIVFQSGNDVITLGSGQIYFVCSFPNCCQSGIKIAINAT